MNIVLCFMTMFYLISDKEVGLNIFEVLVEYGSC